MQYWQYWQYKILLHSIAYIAQYYKQYRNDLVSMQLRRRNKSPSQAAGSMLQGLAGPRQLSDHHDSGLRVSHSDSRCQLPWHIWKVGTL